MIEFHERPLLSYADLSLILLKSARQQGVTLERAASAVRQLLIKAGEPDLPPDPELYRHLGHIQNDLADAGLLARIAPDGFRITPRGEQMLAAHPMGLDRSVLAELPEFQATFREVAAPPQTRSGTSYSEGYSAFRAGGHPADNPYLPDSSDHQAWQNGWSEARDEEESNCAAMGHKPSDGLIDI